MGLPFFFLFDGDEELIKNFLKWQGVRMQMWEVLFLSLNRDQNKKPDLNCCHSLIIYISLLNLSHP